MIQYVVSNCFEVENAFDLVGGWWIVTEGAEMRVGIQGK